jgi:hypothetical protein
MKVFVVLAHLSRSSVPRRAVRETTGDRRVLMALAGRRQEKSS